MLGACSDDGSDSRCGPSSPPFDARSTAYVTTYDEIEPNDDLVNANLPTLPMPRPDRLVGFGVIGSLGDALDAVDFFVFTAERANVFDIELWASPSRVADACVPVRVDTPIDPSVAYFEVLDQNGTLLLSSQGDTAAGNFQEIGIDAGVPYYIAVHAEGALNVTQSYYALAVEKTPPP